MIIFCMMIADAKHFRTVFRVGHHSTSDDSSAYRSVEEIEKWTKDESPIQKFKLYLEQNGL